MPVGPYLAAPRDLTLFVPDHPYTLCRLSVRPPKSIHRSLPAPLAPTEALCTFMYRILLFVTGLNYLVPFYCIPPCRICQVRKNSINVKPARSCDRRQTSMCGSCRRSSDHPICFIRIDQIRRYLRNGAGILVLENCLLLL